MDIHKPKPVHGWREFIGEIGVIVIGVLIALCGEQAVEWLHWQHSVHRASEALAIELGAARANAVERVRTNACVNNRLDAIARILTSASQTGFLPPVTGIGYPPSRLWSQNVWLGANSGQTVDHLPTDKRSAYSAYYADILILDAQQSKELNTWAELSSLIGPGGRIDAASIVDYRRLLSQARFYNRFMGLAGEQFIEELDGNKNIVVDQAASRAVSSADISRQIWCQLPPVGAAPPYGQAPWTGDQRQIDMEAARLSHHN